MKHFFIAAAVQYAFNVNVIMHALSNQLVSLNTIDLWRIVASYVYEEVVDMSGDERRDGVEKEVKKSKEKMNTIVKI